MRRRTLLAAFAAVPLAARADAPLNVVASFSVLADMVRAVGGSAVSVDALVGPDRDVHAYEPTPRDLRAVLAARVLVRNGLGLEGWMDRLADAAGFNGVVAVAAKDVVPRTMAQDGAMATDPHAWQDPRNALLYVHTIAGALAAADPANASTYAATAAAYNRRIADTDAWIAAKLGAVPAERRRIVTTHDAFGYYGVRYGVEFLAAEGISTESQPSAKGIAALVAQIKREKIRAVFLEAMTSDRMARTLARESGAVLGGTVYSDALSPPGGPAATYLDMLRHNTTQFAAAMAGP